MTQYNLGRVVPIFQGEYDPKVNYEVLDVVLYKGSSYVAKGDTVGNLPTDPNNWQLVASAGEGGGVAAIVDSELSTESENPVQNKVITLKINDLESIIVPEETVRQIVEGYGYQNESQVNSSIEAKGYETTTNVDEKLKPYAKKTDIATINGQTITSGGNITIEGGGASVTVDSQMSLDSENPVQNKVITARVNEVEGKIKPIPTKVSELTNDSDFQTKEQVDDNIAAHGYQTASQVNTAIESKGYTTDSAVEAKGYQTKSEVDANIEGRRYTTLNEVSQQGYAKGSDIPHKVSQLTNDEDFIKKSSIATINNQSLTEGGNITIEGGGAAITVDAEMNLNSENPVQNKVITTRINEVEGKIPVDVVTTEQLNAVKATAESKTTLEEVAQQGYAMNSDIPTNNNQLDNGANYTTMQAVEAKGYQTDAQVKATIKTNPEGFAKSSEIPTDNAGLTNGAGYQTASQVESTITGKGYTTMQAVEEKGYQTASDVESKGYQTDAQVKATITSNPDGYAKTTDVDTKLSKKADSTRVDEVVASIPDTTEAWEFTLDDGSVITKNVYVQA